MNIYETVRFKLKMARERNLGYRQLLALWRERRLYLQIMVNFKRLEGSWLGGIRQTLNVSSAVKRRG
jgi:hypothetical protein